MTSASPVHARDRVLALVNSPEAGRRLSADLVEAVGGLDLWVWGTRNQHELDEWRQLDIEPMTAPLALEDLLLHAALARDWDAVATCGVAIAATRALGGEVAQGLWPKSTEAICMTWIQADFSPRLAPHERRALAACANAWNARAARLRRARTVQLRAER